MNCSTCGAANRSESRFCLSCGSRIGPVGPASIPEEIVPPSTPARRQPAFLAAGVVAVALVLVVAGILVLGSGGDANESSPSAGSLDEADDDVGPDATEPSASDAPTPPTAVITPITSPVPETTTAPVTAPVETTLPAPPPMPLTGFPFANAFVVPQLGVEPVRGTGCGGDGSVGDVVPDGWWFGGVEDITSASLLLDLVCVFFGDEADARIADCAAIEGYEICTASWGEEFWPVNNTLRYRVVPVDSALVRAVDGSMACSLADIDRFQGDEFTWVHIVGGRAVHLQHLCPGG